jgi:hypothetical protein
MKKTKEPSVGIAPPREDTQKIEIVEDKQHKQVIDVLNAILKKLERIETNTFKGF